MFSTINIYLNIINICAIFYEFYELQFISEFFLEILLSFQRNYGKSFPKRFLSIYVIKKKILLENIRIKKEKGNIVVCVPLLKKGCL